MENPSKISRKNNNMASSSSSSSFFTCLLPYKLWAVFISFLLFWCLLIYGFNLFSPHGFSTTLSLYDDQEDSLQSYSLESIDNHNNVTKYNPSVLEENRVKSCVGRYIYMHELPSRYNEDLLNNCKSLSKWSNMCMYLQNMGLGLDLGNLQSTFQTKGWFNTNQFSLEVIFHNRMKQYDCLTNDSSKAVAIFVPYYAGLDVARYLFDSNSVNVRDNGSVSLAKWLSGKKEWKVMGGMDHFLVAGRITWDFRRGIDEDQHWGNKLMLLPEFKNTTILTIESSPWQRNDFAIPYPTYFHPSSDNDIREWQNRMRRLKRKTLYCFAGGARPNMNYSIRGEIMDECRSSGRKCKLMECKDERNKCQKPSYVMKMFQNSVFCLQPAGDSSTRRSTFDAILAGCIPVFFTPASAYVQYVWNLPKDYTSYSVLIPEDGVKNMTISIDSTLSRISKSKVASMREEVIKLIPNLIYADPRSHLETFQDAFDLTVRGVLDRVKMLRTEIKEKKNISFGFDEEKSWKYFTFGNVDDHEWDHFFVRTDKSSYY